MLLVCLKRPYHFGPLPTRHRERIKSLYQMSLGTSLPSPFKDAQRSVSPWSYFSHDFHPLFPCLLSSSFSPSALYPTADARTYLAYLLSYEGALKEAKEELKEAMKQDAEFGNAWNDLGLVGGKGGREGGREGGK